MLTIIRHFFFPFGGGGGKWVHWIEKRNSRGRSMDHLKSSSTKNDYERIYCTPVIRGKIQRCKKARDEEFHGF